MVTHFVIGLCVLVAAECSCSGRVPSDQQMVSAFRAHRGTFEQLHAMAANDMQSGFYFSWAQGNRKHPGGGQPRELTSSRWAEYQNLISQIGPKVESIVIRGDGVMRFVFGQEGTAISPGWCKGIEYIPVGTDPGRQGHDHVRQIEPNWFMFYDHFE